MKPPKHPGGGSGNSTGSLGGTASSALFWAGGANAIRDIAQFGSALVLVRLIDTADYGAFAVSQTIVGVIAVFSVDVTTRAALQDRNPEEICWDTHFAVGLVLNSFLFVVAQVIAIALCFVDGFDAIAAPLSITSLLFLTSIGAAIANRRLETAHEWKLFRTLSVAGTWLSLIVQIAVAFSGHGLVALALGPLVFTLPSLAYFVFGPTPRPRLRFEKAKGRRILAFALTQFGTEGALRIVPMVRQSMITRFYGLGVMGLVNRAEGLINLTARRVGDVALQSLYPVITRFPASTEAFNRASGRLLTGVAWVIMPTSGFLLVLPNDIVDVLFGSKWIGLTPFLAPSVLGVVCVTLTTALARLMLANDRARQSVQIEVLNGSVSTLMALLVIPIGVREFLWVFAGWQAVMLALAGWRACATDSIRPVALRTALVAPVIATSMGWVGARSVHDLLFEGGGWAWVRISFTVICYSLLCGAVYRLAFKATLGEVCAAVPMGDYLRRWMRC